MPTALRDGPYRCFFYASDCGEPPHIHVERDDRIAKFWLFLVRLASSGGFPRAEIPRLQRLVLEHQFELKEAWMLTVSRIELDPPLAAHVSVTDDTLSVDLRDGRSLQVPLAWYPRLTYGSLSERADWRLIGEGQGIHWESLDEDISLLGLLEGKPSGESSESLQRWLKSRSPNTSA